MRILVNHNGQTLGPFSIEEIRSNLAVGRLLPTDLTLVEGAETWIPVASLPGLEIGGEAAPFSRTGVTSNLAIASLILGLLSPLCCALFTGLPAVICGHLALAEIRRAKGMLGGQGMAIGGLISGYLGILFGTAVMAALVLPVFTATLQSKKSSLSLIQARQISGACKNYATDHGGKLPNSLEELIPEFLPDRKSLIDPSQPESDETGYFYYGSSRLQSEGNLQVLFVSKAAYSHGLRVVAHFNGVVALEQFTPPTE